MREEKKAVKDVTVSGVVIATRNPAKSAALTGGAAPEILKFNEMDPYR